MSNKLIIAAAGSGKTTYIVNESLKEKNYPILITTFTENNEREIIKKFYEINGSIPENIKIQTWFSFLLKNGVKPYQSFLIDEPVTGLNLVSKRSGVKYYNKNKIPVYYKEEETQKHYFDGSMKIYSDKISKFVIRVNELTQGLIVERIAKIYKYIFIDEIQDMAGYDLEIIKLFLKSAINVLMVGDPRQVTYHTHDEQKYSKYADGGIEQFIIDECKDISIEIDNESLKFSHRNNEKICYYSNLLYPNFENCISKNKTITEHDGVFFVKKNNLEGYLKKYCPTQLRDKINITVVEGYETLNFGESKGITRDRVIIYPTKPFLDWIVNNSVKLAPSSRSKFYVAITRAKYSVAIVVDNDFDVQVSGVEYY